ncbi:MAG: sulfotransferase [Candidatus Rokuibacteriota bacterium]
MATMQSAARGVIRAANTTGRGLRRLGFETVSLDERVLLEAACRETRLEDFGGDEFREPLRLVLEGLETEARLTLLGRVVARRDLIGLLTNRLRLTEDRKRYPGIADQRIARPFFIIGLPRTGSTLLHHLISQDPASRAPQAWEVMTPSPPPEAARYETDPRIADAERKLAWLDWLAPDFKAIHPLGARLAIECIAILSHTFLSSRFHTTYRTPSYQAWLKKQDRTPAYAYHRRFLQHLQWRAGADRWVLKAPAHLYALDALLAIYPDALIVQTHRDPRMVLGSVASLTLSLQSAFAEPLDPAEIGREVLQSWTEGLERGMHVRHSGLADAERFFDVNYQQLLADPIGTVRRIYAHFGLPLTAAAEDRMRSHLNDNPQHKHGRHAYDLKAFGLDGPSLDQQFGSYREFFGIEPEAP